MANESCDAAVTAEDLIEHDRDVVVVVDAEFTITSVSRSASDLYGADASRLVGTSVADLIHPDDLERGLAAYGELVRHSGKRPPGMYRISLADGTYRALDVFAENLSPGSYAYHLRPLDERRRAEALAAEQIEVMERLAEGASLRDCLSGLSLLAARHLDHCWVVLSVEDRDASDTPVVVTQTDCPEPLWRRATAAERHGFENRIEATARTMAAVTERTALREWPGMANVVDRSGLQRCVTWPIEVAGRGVVGFAEIYSTSTTPPDGPEWRIHELVVRLASLMIGQVRSTVELERAAVHDPLTGVANRRLLTATLHDLAARRRPYTVMTVDLDQFSWVNNTLGHDAGDQLLVVVAERITAAVPDDVLVARQGGDEFVVLIPGVRPVEEIVETARRLCAEVRRPVEIGGVARQTRTSIGIAISPGDPDPSRPLTQSDQAMYAAKRDGGDGVRVFDQAMRSLLSRRLTLAEQLEYAIAAGQLRLAYQPVVRLATGVVSGVEALVRWDHPQFGLLTPEHFVPLAEELGVITMIDEWVTAAAWRQLHLWQPLRPGHDPLTMWVNVSARNLLRRDAVQRLVDTLGADPSPGLGIEITERDVVVDLDQAAWAISCMRAAGFPVALDDFGTGASSLANLAHLDVSHLKVDRSFTAGIVTDGRYRALVEAVLDLGRRLGCEVTAEGVEDREQLAVLRDAQCGSAQGYLLARPMVAGEISTLLGDDLMGRLVEPSSPRPASQPAGGPAGLSPGRPSTMLVAGR